MNKPNFTRVGISHLRFSLSLVQWRARSSLKFEFLRLETVLRQMNRGKLFLSSVETVNTHTQFWIDVYGTMTWVCSSGGCYTKACPEPFLHINCLYSLRNSNVRDLLWLSKSFIFKSDLQMAFSAFCIGDKEYYYYFILLFILFLHE